MGPKKPKRPKRSQSYFEELLHRALGLPTIGDAPTIEPSQYSDVIFVSIDFESGDKIESRAKSGTMGGLKAAHAGVSIFDTRILSSPSPQEALRTYNLGLGGSRRDKERINRRFLFGETSWIHIVDLLDSIENLVDRTRNIVLVGHGFGNDLYVLQSLGFDSETSIVGILDTYSLAHRIFGHPEARGGLTLKSILAKLKCPVQGCHIAGNDANFALRAILLLAAQHYSGLEDSLDDNARERLEKIKAIGHYPLQSLSTPPTQIAKKRKTRFQNLR